MQSLVDNVTGTIISIGEVDFAPGLGQRVVPLPLTPADDRDLFIRTNRVNLDGSVRLATPDEIATAIKAATPADGHSFERALLGVFPDVLQRNALLSKYPLFLWALRGEGWADVRAMLADAQVSGIITPDQAKSVTLAAQAANIPA